MRDWGLSLKKAAMLRAEGLEQKREGTLHFDFELIFTIEDKRNTKITKAFDDISVAIKEVKAELKSEMQSRDLGHDQRVTAIALGLGGKQSHAVRLIASKKV